VTTDTRPRLVGIFTVLGLALIALGFLAIGSSRLFRQTRTFVVFFPNPVGLKPGAPVTFRQAPLGEVREVELVFTGRGFDSEIKVVADVQRGRLRDLSGKPYIGPVSDREFAEILIKAGLRASVRSSSPVAGQKSLELDFQPDSKPRFSGIAMPYPELPTAPTGIEILQDRVEAAIEHISELPVAEILEQVKATFTSAQKLLDSGDLQGALVNLRRGLASADRTLVTAERTFGGMETAMGEVRTTLSSADITLKRLDTTLERLDRTAATIDRNVERTADTQHTAGHSLDELTELLKTLRHLVDTMQRNPEALLRGKPDPEVKK